MTTAERWRIRGVGGLFYEDYRIHDEADWFYLTALPYFIRSRRPPATSSSMANRSAGALPAQDLSYYPPTPNNPNVRPLGTPSSTTSRAVTSKKPRTHPWTSIWSPR